MSEEQNEPKFVRHARLFELLRQESIAQHAADPTPQGTPEPQMSEQELLARALGSLNPRG